MTTLAISSVFRNIRVTYCEFHFLLWEIDKKITIRVEIGIFPIPITYWLGFKIFKQNQENPNEIGIVGQSANNYPAYHEWFHSSAVRVSAPALQKSWVWLLLRPEYLQLLKLQLKLRQSLVISFFTAVSHTCNYMNPLKICTFIHKQVRAGNSWKIVTFKQR